MEDVVMALEAPPRTLEVKHFAKARIAELLSLHAAIKKRKAATHKETDNCDKTNKDSTSLPRHLRRRTSSYTRRRRPLPWLYKQKKNKTVHITASSSSSSIYSALHSEKKSRAQKEKNNVNSGECDQSIHLGKESKNDPCKRKKLCRGLRRLIEFKSGGSLIANNGTRRLSTHLWHAKRFSMDKKWGYYLPIGRPGKYVLFLLNGFYKSSKYFFFIPILLCEKGNTESCLAAWKTQCFTNSVYVFICVLSRRKRNTDGLRVCGKMLKMLHF